MGEATVDGLWQMGNVAPPPTFPYSSSFICRASEPRVHALVDGNVKSGGYSVHGAGRWGWGSAPGWVPQSPLCLLAVLQGYILRSWQR